MTFAMVLPLRRTSISFSAGVGCFLAHTGSASMASGLSLGAFPSKVTVPVMDEAANATPGESNTATNPASHTLFPVLRMLGSLIIENLEWGDSTPGHAVGATPPLGRTRVRRSRRQSI